MDTDAASREMRLQDVHGENPALAAASYPLGAVSAGLIPFFLFLWACRRGKAHLAFQCKQAMMWNVVIVAMTGCVVWLTGLGVIFVYLATGLGGGAASSVWEAWNFVYAANLVIMLWPMVCILMRRRFSFPVFTRALLAHYRGARDCEAMLRSAVDFVWYVMGAMTLGVGPLLLQGRAKRAGMAISPHMVRARNNNLILLGVLGLAMALGAGGSVVLLLVGWVGGERVAMLVPWVGLGLISVIVVNLVVGLLAGWRADAGR